MGKVFLAARDGTNERVAIKVLPPKKALEEEEALRRFRREMEFSNRVKHPNLARMIGVGTEGDVHFMVLEYIPGESLYQAVKGENGGPLRVTDTARLFLKVLDGLDAAHTGGLIHRDIKPSNIMITPEGDARLLDLGLARLTEEEKPLTRPNLVVGTLDYASPEQLTNASSADRRSDLYSVGCTLYFTLAGRPPFEGGDIVNKIFKQRMEDPEPLEQIARGVPASFAAIVRKLMAKDPDDRHQTCAELRADLARWIDPEKLRTILGAEADAARVFRPPVPELDDDDLRLFPDDSAGGVSSSLRDLGAAEPAAAPISRPSHAPVAAVVIPPGDRRIPAPVSGTAGADDDTRWLIQFIAVAVVLGLLAILAITLFV
jgi:eukaryotic-like serine/threonine-protein kinase